MAQTEARWRNAEAVVAKLGRAPLRQNDVNLARLLARIAVENSLRTILEWLFLDTQVFARRERASAVQR